MHDTCLTLVPLRSFSTPKTRLRTVLTADERAALVERLAAGVVAALDGLPTAVLTDDDEVGRWATGLGVRVIRPAGPGLNHAVTTGFRAAREGGFATVAVAPADLAVPGDLADVVTTSATDAVTAVPDRHLDGTNVLVVPTAVDFGFAYGPGSFRLHEAEAHRLGVGFTRVDRVALGWDVDTPDDLAWYVEHAPR